MGQSASSAGWADGWQPDAVVMNPPWGKRSEQQVSRHWPILGDSCIISERGVALCCLVGNLSTENAGDDGIIVRSLLAQFKSSVFVIICPTLIGCVKGVCALSRNVDTFCGHHFVARVK
jgi:hypothetical protein